MVTPVRDLHSGFAWIRSEGEVPRVLGNYDSELPDLSAEPGPDHCRSPAAHEGMWENRRDTFQLFLSQLVIDEASAGDPAAARERLKALRDLPLLDITPEVTELASRILDSGKIPRKAATDAAHIAIAAVHGMDFLVTWNCVHIANATNARALNLICREHGYDCPVICTPEELMGE